jgi:hypothetical protein
MGNGHSDKCSNEAVRFRHRLNNITINPHRSFTNDENQRSPKARPIKRWISIVLPVTFLEDSRIFLILLPVAA